MKKVTIIIIIFSSIIFFFSCTKLEITNNTSFDLDLIQWIDEDGDTEWFGTDRVWDYVLNKYLDGMRPGGSDEKDVDPGDSPIYFWAAAGGPEWRTVDWIEVEKNKSESYTIHDSTLVVELGIASVKTYKLSDVVKLSQMMTTEDNRNKRIDKYMQMKGE